MIRYYDIGLNLFCSQFKEPEVIIANAEHAGVKCILTGSDMTENRKIAKFLRTHDLYGTCGIHPHSADHAKEQDFAEMERILTENKRVVAVGECGLDYDRMFSTQENQLACLERHIRLAETLGMPLFLHERSAAKDFAATFKGHEEICKRSVVHCFTGTRQELEIFLEMGFCIGITGWICDDRRGTALREAVRMIPLDRIMIETDAPYLIPKNVKGLGSVNVPQNIRYVAAELAKHMQVDESELKEYALENTRRFFGLE